MTVTALKTRAREKPAIAIAAPPERSALAQTIGRAKAAAHVVEMKRQALTRAVEAVERAETALEAARAAIAKAKEHDARRAVAGLSGNRRAPSATAVLTARAVEAVEASLEVTVAARAKLETIVAEVEDDASEAANDVLVAIRALTLRTAQRLYEETLDLKKHLAIKQRILSELVSDDERGAPRFGNGLREMRARGKREAVTRELRPRAQSLLLLGADDAMRAAAADALARWKSALAALRLDASAPLPSSL